MKFIKDIFSLRSRVVKLEEENLRMSRLIMFKDVVIKQIGKSPSVIDLSKLLSNAEIERKVFNYYTITHKTPEQIRDITGLSLPTVRRRLERYNLIPNSK